MEMRSYRPGDRKNLEALLPLQACTWETSRAGVRFLERQGFTVVRRTWEPVLHLAEVDLAAMPPYEERCQRLGYTLHSLLDVAQHPEHEERLAALFAEVYIATHGINPPRSDGRDRRAPGG